MEALILDNIRATSGLVFQHIPGIDTRSKETANLVLPILAQWPARIDDRHLRHAIYGCFHTKYARDYFDLIISWWLSEEFPLAVASLSQTIALLLKPEDAEHFWNLYKSSPAKPFHYLLLAQLARLNSPVSTDVIEVLIHDLNARELTPADLKYISRVAHPTIHEWFTNHVDSSNRQVRAIARKASQRGNSLPKGVIRWSGRPTRDGEVLSREVNLDEVELVLRSVASQLGIELPPVLGDLTFLSSLIKDEWAITVAETTEGRRPVCIWFRLEDLDTVEIMITNEVPPSRLMQ